MASMASKLESVSDDSPEEVMRTAEGEYLPSLQIKRGAILVYVSNVY